MDQTFNKLYGPQVDYDTALNNVFASGSIPDGYFGDRAQVQFSLVDGRIFTVAEYGCFNAGLPLVTDIEEAMFVLKRHLSSNAKNIKRICNHKETYCNSRGMFCWHCGAKVA